MRLLIPLLLTVLALSFSPLAQADVPNQLLYQGRLLQDDVPLEGDITITILIERDDQTIYNQVRSILFKNGYYKIELGPFDGDQFPDISELFAEGQLYLSLSLVDDSDTIIPILDREPLHSVPFAMAAFGVYGGPVVSSDISVSGQDNTEIPVINSAGSWTGNPMQENNISDLAIGMQHIQDGAIQKRHIEDETIESRHLSSGAVTSAKLANDAVESSKIANNAILGEHIMDGAVSSADIANNSLQSADIQDDTLTADDVKPGGGIYAHKTDLYEVRESFSISGGLVVSKSASCNDDNDLALSGGCHSASTSGASFHSSQALHWSDPSAPAEYQCTFANNQGGSVTAEAQIICVSVP